MDIVYQISKYLYEVVFILMLGFLIIESIKEALTAYDKIGKINVKFWLNRWSIMIPIFLIVFWISLSFLHSLFDYIAIGVIRFAAFEFEEHIIGGIIIGLGVAICIGITGTIFLLMFRYWRAGLTHRAFILFTVFLLFATLSWKMTPLAENKIYGFYIYHGVEKKILIQYVQNYQAVTEKAAEYLVNKWYDKFQSDENKFKQIFYFFVCIGAIVSCWGFVFLHNRFVDYLFKSSIPKGDK